ncbi:hypothetical protein M3231_11950 [Neobacillus mesonae]|nr:hypothetical protein [Neobacillus mesonae]
MSKQEHLISAEKLQKELETEIGYLSGDSNYQRGRVEGYQWVLARLESGTFNADLVPTIKPGDKVNQYQIAVIRTLWELAQGRIDELYSDIGAEEEKQAVEAWIMRVFPKEVWSELVRAGSEVVKDE